MTADIVDINSARKPNPGNGAREALIDIVTRHTDTNASRLTDQLLAELWARGFKVVPLDGSE